MAIREYKKGIATQLTPSYKSTDFDCKCSRSDCKITKIDDKLLSYIVNLEKHFGKKVDFSSYRCPRYNSAVGGVKGSFHLKGMAADIEIQGLQPIEIARYCEKAKIHGIGLYDSFVHIDSREESSKYFWYGHEQEKRRTFQAKGTPSEENNTIIDTNEIDLMAINEQMIWDYLSKIINNDIGVAVIMGNLYFESSLIPTYLSEEADSLNISGSEYTLSVDDGSYKDFKTDNIGYGLAQWKTWIQKTAMLEFHTVKSASIGDIYTQLDFLVNQLSSDYSEVWNVICNAKNIKNTSDIFLKNFLQIKSNTDDQIKRAEKAIYYFNNYSSQKTLSENSEPLWGIEYDEIFFKKIKDYNAGNISEEEYKEFIKQLNQYEKSLENLSQAVALGKITNEEYQTTVKDLEEYEKTLEETFKEQEKNEKPKEDTDFSIEKLKVYLISLGYDCSPINNSKNEQTVQAIETFQKNNNLEINGEYNKNFLSVLENKIKKGVKYFPSEPQILYKKVSNKFEPLDQFTKTYSYILTEFYYVRENEKIIKYGKIENLGWIKL